MRKKDKRNIRKIRQKIDCKSGLVVEVDVDSNEEILIIADAFYPPIDIVTDGVANLAEFCVNQKFSDMVTASIVDAYVDRFIDSARHAQLKISDIRVIKLLRRRMDDLLDVSERIQAARCKSILNAGTDV